MPWHRLPLLAFRPWDQTTGATGLPEARSRPRAARQLPDAAVPGDVPPALGVSGTGSLLAAFRPAVALVSGTRLPLPLLASGHGIRHRGH
ncbi:hypothetical protein ACP86_05975 [Marinobacter sp. CP1]|uniref:hypothetical protein n=1 Tax=Marinobacter sp. CP1 TaxID=1671721 RepID=UPI00069F597A|nr:hypothetical protein [Marinobacter sp. CP1]AKV95746.1 hypothetical protein ACP86_05975 [Marinobacter sp. CP1]